MDQPPIIRPTEPITLPMAGFVAPRPTWATVIAVIGIVFAVIELLAAVGTPLQIIMQRFQQQLISNPQFMSALASQPAFTASSRHARNPATTSPNSANPPPDENYAYVNNAWVKVGATAGPAGVASTQASVSMPPAFAALFQQIATTPPWFDAYMIANGVESLIAGVILLVGSIFLLQQRSTSRGWLIAYAVISLLWAIAIIVLAVTSKNLAFANQGMCAMSCGAPLPIVLIIMLLLPAQRQWFAQRRALERTAPPAL